MIFLAQLNDWTTVAIQAGGAIAVCGMFLWFLKQKQIADDKRDNEFLSHLMRKDEQASADADRQMNYLKQRDAQSKEIAQTGHAALMEVANQVNELRLEMKNKNKGSE